PQFRLPDDVVAADVKSITDLGVTIRTNVRIANDAALERLKNEYDAVILSGGCMLPQKIDMQGLDAKGIFWGLKFMMAANREEITTPMEKVLVIGGGFTAVDCARMSYRLGARKVALAYRRNKDNMKVGSHELDDMEEEGIDFIFMASPVDIKTSNGKVAGLKLVRNYFAKDHSIQPIPGSEFIFEADTVIFAIGQGSEENISTVEREAQVDNFFVAGDFRNGASTVIEAASDGRKVAREVHKFLSGIKGYRETIQINKVKETGRKRDFDFIPAQTMDKTHLRDRWIKNKEVESGFSKERSLIEARRCYLCHYNFQIDIDRCIYCLACIDVMPVDCIKMAKDVRVSQDGNLRYVETKKWDEVEAITIDNDKCIRCGNCARVCPVECISISKYKLTIEE
ncbi:MAG: FAD-dependent oxidoreductase, partial [Candidatus Scalindua sp.]